MSVIKNEEINKLDVIIAAFKIFGYGMFFCLYGVCLFVQMLLEGDFSDKDKFKSPDA